MTYRHGADLQRVIFERLTSDPEIAERVGGAVFDMAPVGEVPPVYIVLGPEEVTDRSDQSAGGAVHQVSVIVVSRESGFFDAKQVAQMVAARLDGFSAPLGGTGVLSRMTFQRARARRGPGGATREIRLSYRARVDDMT